MSENELSENQWSLYIIETECGKYYTGITKDVEKRFEEHRDSPKGAKFFRSATPKKLVYTQTGLNHSQALKLEIHVKKLTKPQKTKLIKLGEPLPVPL